MKSLALAAALSFAFGLPGAAQAGGTGDDGVVMAQDGATVTIAQVGLFDVRAPADDPAPAMFPDGASPGSGPTLRAVFADAARAAGVDTRLLQAIAWHESRYRQEVVSGRGAIGVMQIMPRTARWLGIDPRDVVQNIRGGAALLGYLLRSYRGDVELALAAYSAGPAAVRRYGGVPPYAETRNYLADIRRVAPF